MMHILLLPLIWASHAGGWVNDHVLSPFQLGNTAKEVVEEEFGCYGVLAYLIFKTSRLLVEAWPLFQSRWIGGRIARSAVLLVALLLSAWLLTCMYVGMLIPILALNVSWRGLLLSPVIAWVALAYVLLAERVHARRAELEAQPEGED